MSRQLRLSPAAAAGGLSEKNVHRYPALCASLLPPRELLHVAQSMLRCLQMFHLFLQELLRTAFADGQIPRGLKVQKAHVVAPVPPSAPATLRRDRLSDFVALAEAPAGPAGEKAAANGAAAAQQPPQRVSFCPWLENRFKHDILQDQPASVRDGSNSAAPPSFPHTVSPLSTQDPYRFDGAAIRFSRNHRRFPPRGR